MRTSSRSAQEDLDTDALFSQVVIDKPLLASRIRQALQTHSQITLCDLLDAHRL